MWNNFREKLHAGIARDVQRQEERRFENMYVLEQQRELTKKLREREKQMKDELSNFGDGWIYTMSLFITWKNIVKDVDETL